MEDAGRPPRAVYRFDRFTLDLARGALLGPGGAELPLRPKSFALLQLFVENAGRLLDRDMIMAAVWPGVFVTDDSIGQCIRDIRRALGDEAQRLLKTVPRRGYLLDTEVSRAGSAVPAAKEPSAVEKAGSQGPPTPEPERTGSKGLQASPGVERRQLTVLFCDLVGSSALADQLDPEDFSEVIRAYQECCAAAVVRFGGHVAKYMGDGVLAYFGYPHAHEDAAEQAVRAGLAIVRAVADLGVRPDLALRARVGIATGLVVSGPAGEGGQSETAVGRPLNLAARLQEIAGPGAVVIADETRRLLGEAFALRDLGTVELKGFAHPAHAFEVLSERPGVSRFEARHGSTLLPMLGRDQELALLLERWRLARSGEGQAVLLTGEPGIGKSRIVRALADALEPERPVVLRYQCSPLHADSPLWPVTQQLTFAADLRADDPAAVTKLEALLRRADEPDEEALALLAELLGIEGVSLPGALSAQQKRDRLLQVLTDQLAGLARGGPILVLFEDVHWADPTSLELIEQSLDRTGGLAVLFVLTSRPDGQPTLGGHPHLARLTLNRLGRAASEAIIGTLAGSRQLPDKIAATILSRSDGVPLFVEELTKAVLEAGPLEGDERRNVPAGPPLLAVPSTLHDSLMARLDRLATAKEVAQIGAVIGREFPYRLLAAVARLREDELNRALGELGGAELVFRRGTPPEASYTFKHALVQDAAYQSLLKSRRQELHGRVAEALERDFPHTTETQPEVLARHCAEAGLTGRAIELWRAAGEQALARAANREAAAFLERALAALGSQAETPELLARVVDLRRSLYNATYKFGELHRTRANLVEAERLAARLNDSTRLCRIQVDMTYILGCMGDIDGAIASGERAVASAALGEDLEARVQSRVQLARSLYAKGRYHEAIGHIRDVIGMLGEDVPRGQLGPGLNQTISARVWLVLFHAELGEFAVCAARASEAQELAVGVEGAWGAEGQVWLRLALGRTAVLRGDFAAAAEVLEPAVAPCESEFAIYYSRVATSLGVAYARSGRVERGLTLLQTATERDRAIGFGFRFGLHVAQLGEVLLLAGDADGALEAGARALEAARTSGEEASEAWALCLLGDVEAARGDHRIAEERYREALAIADRLEMAAVRRHCLERLRSRMDDEDRGVPHPTRAE